MGAVVAFDAAAGGSALDGLLAQRRIWRGRTNAVASPIIQATGWSELDAALPTGGWPEAALTELLLQADGVGELQLLWPTLARLSQPKDGVIALIAPPYRPYPPAWHAAGVRLGALQVVATRTPRDALWAAEQCLRSGACDAVLCWPHQADDRALRRLQVAAESGQALGFAFRPMKAALNPSPAALRIALDAAPRQVRILKSRGGNPPARPIPFPSPASAAQREECVSAMPFRGQTPALQEATPFRSQFSGDRDSAFQPAGPKQGNLQSHPRSIFSPAKVRPSPSAAFVPAALAHARNAEKLDAEA